VDDSDVGGLGGGGYGTRCWSRGVGLGFARLLLSLLGCLTTGLISLHQGPAKFVVFLVYGESFMRTGQRLRINNGYESFLFLSTLTIFKRGGGEMSGIRHNRSLVGGGIPPA
jgi:hypothetical protein